MKYIESIQQHLFEIVSGFNIRESPPPFGSAKCEDLVNLTWLLMLQFPCVVVAWQLYLAQETQVFGAWQQIGKNPTKVRQCLDFIYVLTYTIL